MQQKILIRLPNWLGDLVMSTAFVNAVYESYPTAIVDLITKKGIDALMDNFPAHRRHFVFSKDEYSGLTGAWKFGKEIAAQEKYDLFFCLPDSLSSSVMAKATGAAKRIGYKKELRSFLLTDSYKKKENLHRVEEYIDLLNQFTQKSTLVKKVSLNVSESQFPQKAVIININSEASSRRLPKQKAISIINSIRENIAEEIILVGSSKEKLLVDEVYNALADKTKVTNVAGHTSLSELISLMSNCTVMFTTDSGPAHVANALGLQTIVLFGAGNEKNTAPYNKENCVTIRLGQLPCEPCVSNTCKKYGVPKCLLLLDETILTNAVKNALNKKIYKWNF